MENRKKYIGKMAARLKDWDDEILKMEVKVANARAELKTEYHKQIMELLMKKDAALLKLKHLKDAGDDAWEELKAGAEDSWAILDNSIKNAWAKIK